MADFVTASPLTIALSCSKLQSGAIGHFKIRRHFFSTAKQEITNVTVSEKKVKTKSKFNELNLNIFLEKRVYSEESTVIAMSVVLRAER